MPAGNNYLPIGEAAEYLGVSQDTLRRWESQSKLTAIRPDGKNRYFSLTDLDNIKTSGTLSVSDSAKLLDISASSIRRLTDNNLLPSIRQDNGYRVFQKSDVLIFKDSQEFKDFKNPTKIQQELKTGNTPVEPLPVPMIINQSSERFTDNVQKQKDTSTQKRSGVLGPVPLPADPFPQT